jgi:hypothetical protein
LEESDVEYSAEGRGTAVVEDVTNKPTLDKEQEKLQVGNGNYILMMYVIGESSAWFFLSTTQVSCSVSKTRAKSKV